MTPMLHVIHESNIHWFMTVIFSLLKWGAFSSQVNLPVISSECNSVIPGFSPVENGAPFHRRMPKPVYANKM